MKDISNHHIGVNIDDEIMDVKSNASLGDILDEAVRRAAPIEPPKKRFFGEKPLRFPNPKALPPRNDTPITSELAAADNQVVDSDAMIRAFNIEGESLASRLRQRATMMRQRADQFDQRADAIERQAIPSIADALQSIADDFRDIENILRAHAHIEPKRE